MSPAEYVFCPVPPFPVSSVPVTSAVPRFTAEDERTPEALDLTIPVPNPNTFMSPVEALPRVKDCSAVVAMTPSAVK